MTDMRKTCVEHEVRLVREGRRFVCPYDTKLYRLLWGAACDYGNNLCGFREDVAKFFYKALKNKVKVTS